MRRLALAGLLAVTVAAGAGGLAFVGRASGTDDQQGYLASLISSALSTSSTQVHIGGVDGALSSDATIRDLVISDRDGPWLKLDRARLVWRRAALLLRRLEVDDLEIAHLEILRRPLRSPKPKDAKDDQLLPDLPVKVEIKQFAMANLDLGAPILGTAMRAAATGETILGSPSEGLKFSLDGKRLDSPGSLKVAFDYVPKGQALRVKVALHEPPGGLLSKVAHLQGEPPVTFRLGGDGTLDSFAGRLDFRAGPAIDAAGALTLQRHEAGRDLAVRVGGRLGVLLPSVAAPVFEGNTDLAGDARFGDDGGFALDRVALTSHLARLDAHGTLGADSTMDFDLAMRAVPSQGDATALAGATIRKLVLDAAAQGTVRRPRIRAALALADADLPQGRLGALDVRFTAAPSGDIASADTRVAFEGGATASGIASHDVRLASAIGGSAKLALAGRLDRHGVATFDTLTAETPTAALAYAGDIAASHVHGRLTARAPDLSRIGDLAGLRLAGSVAAGLDLDGTPDTQTMRAALAASGRDLATGLPAVDGLLGGKVDAHGKLQLADDSLRIDDLVLDAAHLSARVAGAIPAKEDPAKPSAIDAHVTLPDLAKADPRLTGTAHLDAHVAGGLDRPTLSLDAALDNATALGRPIPHLALAAQVIDPRGAATASATLDGGVDRKLARGRLTLARHDKGWDLSKLDVAIGSVSLQGSGHIDGSKLIDGSLRLAAGNLDDLSPLALTRLGGTLALDATLAAPDARQNATLTARADNLFVGPASVHAVSVRAAASDLYGRPIIDADAKLDRAVVAGQTISTASFAAKGSAARSAITLAARTAGFDLDAAGALVSGAATRFDLASFAARRGARRIALTGPASLTLADGGVAIDHLALGIAGGRLAVAGRAGKSLDLTLDAKAIPLAAADIAVPGLALGGTLDADARIGGTPADPTGPYHLTIKHLVVPQARDAGVPPIDVAASGRLEHHRASLDAKIAAGRAGMLQASGSLPLDATGLLDLSLRGKLDAAVANARLSADGRTVTGSVLVDAKLGGTSAAPRVAGTATMSGGSFRDALLGVRLDGIEARMAANGDHVAIERLAASTPNGGKLSGSGDVKLDPAAGFPGRIALQGHDAQLVASSLMTATANLDLTLSGALARAPRVAGRVDLTRALVGVPDRLPTTLQPIGNVTHVNPPAALAAKIAAARKAERLAAKGSRGIRGRPSLFEAALDVTVAAENGLFVRGRGIDAELGGNLHVTGSTEKPVPQGAFDLQHGTIAALGKTLTFSKGKVTFSGDLMPEVDFAAQIAAPDITAQIAVTGPATAPKFKFSSIPDLPQDEVLSRVMFQKPSGSLSGFQALQLAQAAAQFSGDGDGVYQKMMSSLGVTPSASGDDGLMSKLSRALGDRVSVGVVTGATADQTGLSADVAVTKHLRVQSDVRSNGSTSVGVGSEIEY